ncbi:MAG TPA: CPBP family intramembrane glutamic endopeptidase [Myxococcota bacterium]|nr:CPBP family intramembrane glutamic endopeptidase [Myxococcota bacterium]
MEQARVAAQLLARYERRNAEAPDDAVAAMERCLFLGAAFYDPEAEANPREDERRACVEEVETRFATDPEARVFAIEQRWGDDAVDAGQRFLADPPRGAEPRHLAAVHSHLARQQESDRKDDSDDALAHAQQAMSLDPSLDLRILVARKLMRAGDRVGARRALTERLADTRVNRELETKASLLADLGAFESSLAAFREIERRGEQPRRWFTYARALAGTGQIDAARAMYAEKRDEWVRDAELRARFEFELEHGTPASARAAYDSLQARGWGMDPFGRDRLALLLAHPGAAWRSSDLLGLGALAALALALLLIPAIWILPVYAFGILRGGRAAAPAGFGLRDAWAASAVLIFAQMLPLVIYPDVFDEARPPDSGVELARFAVLVAALSVIGLWIVFRHQLMRLFDPGIWGWTRVLVSAIGLVIAFRVIAVSAASLSRREGIPSTNATTEAMLSSLQRHFGLSVSLLVIALVLPLFEELVFRGILLSAFRSRLPAGLANFAQAALFAAFHANPAGTPAYFLLGCVAGRFTRVSGSLRAALLAHVLNNAIACAIAALRSSG